MRRKLNLRLLAWSLGGLTVTVLVVFLLHRFQVHRNAGILLEQADHAAAEGRLAQSASYLQHYLHYVPNDLDTLTRYAQTRAKIGGSPTARYRAFLLLEQVLRRDGSRQDVRRQAIAMAQELYRFNDAARHLEILLRTSDKEADLWYRLGWCQEADGEFSKAEVSYNRALALDAKHLAAYERLGNLLLLRLERPTEVEQLLDRMVAANADSYQAYLGRARYLRTIARLEPAWEDVRQARRLAPDNPEVVLIAAELEVQRGDPARARTELESGLQVNPGHVGLIRALAWLEWKQDRPDQAIACLRRGLEKAPNVPELLVALADLLVDKGPSPEADALVDRLRQESIEPGIVECLEGRLLFQRGQLLLALDRAENAERLLQSSVWLAQAAHLLGRCHERLGDLDEAVAAYRRAATRNSTWVGPRQALAGVLLAAGRYLEALVEIQMIREVPTAIEVTQALLARALIEQNRRSPEDQREWPEIEHALQRAATGPFDPVELALLRAEVLTVRQQWDQAEKLLLQARAAHPKSVQPVLALADLALRRDRRDQVRQLLQEVRDQLGDSLELRLSWVRFWTGATGRAARQGLLEQEQGLDKLAPGEQVRLLRELAAGLYRLGDAGSAERLWLSLSQRLPRDLSSRLLLFDVALQDGRENEARRWLDELQRLEGQQGLPFHDASLPAQRAAARGKFWRFAEAALLATQSQGRDRRKLEQAREVLTSLTQQFRDWGRPYLLLGTIAQWRGEPEQAIKDYKRALELGEAQPESVVRLARLLLDRGQYIDAEQAIRKVEQFIPHDRQLTRLAAETALKGVERDRAVALARQVVAPENRDYRDALWLADLLLTADRPGEAEKVLRQAAQHSGSVPDVWVALVRLLGQKGTPEQVQAALQQMREQVPVARVPTTLARCHEALERLDEAEKLYAQAWSGSVDDFMGLKHLAEFYVRRQRFDQAEPLLRKQIDPAARLPSQIVARARRHLACGLAATGDEKKLAEAVRLLDQNKAQFSPELDDELARAVVLAALPKHRKEAIALFERVQQQRPALEPSAQLVLARLYEAEGEVDRAANLLQGLVAGAPGQPDYLASYVELLLRRKDIDDARHYLERLQKIEPQATRTRQLRELLEETVRKLAVEG